MKLIRYHTPKFPNKGSNGILGILCNQDGNRLSYTVEREWNNNKPFVSCIPDGIYELQPVNSTKYGETYAIVNEKLMVSKFKKEGYRYACLLHAANRHRELMGCIAPVTSLNRDLSGGVKSRDALEKVLNYVKETGDFVLEIETETCTIQG